MSRNPFFTRLRNFTRVRGTILQLAGKVALRAFRSHRVKPVIFFNASTRLGDTSLNAGFASITSWALRMAGVPAIHFVCNSGMSRCVLGTDPDHLEDEPPCGVCVRHSRFLTFGAQKDFFSYQRDEALAILILHLSLTELEQFSYEGIPLGSLVLPALRWRLRVHHLENNEPTRWLYREFILSAWNVGKSFNRLLEVKDPQVVVVFNGQFFPEAVVRFLAMRRGIRVITHEVGLQPVSAYFTDGEATAYPIHIPEEFELNEEQNTRLDAYLEKRFQGKFSMAGVQFWPEMKGLDETFLKRMEGFRQVVPVFTNVAFDTSQPHSNVIFPDMFTWLDLVLESIKENPDTLFIIRAHPDESRKGKAARESVTMWVERNKVDQLENVVFIPPDEYISSYDLIKRSKFIMIYNSTIGLEASILGMPVLCAGKARFTQYPTVFFPSSRADYHIQLASFLQVSEIPVPKDFRRNARRFLYYQLFRTSLPFAEFLDETSVRGYVTFRKDGFKHLQPDSSPVIRTVLNGILRNGDFLLEDE